VNLVNLKKLFPLVEVTRPHSAAAAALATLVGVHLSGPVPSYTWLQAAVVTWLLAAAGNSFNDSRDALIDAVNRPDRPIPAGRLSARTASTFAHSCFAAALVLAIPLGPLSTAGTVAAGFLLYAYTLFLRGLPLVGNLTVATLSAMAVEYGGVLGGDARGVLYVAVFVFVFMFSREVLKTIPDEAGDAKAGIQTVTTRWGASVSMVLARLGTLALAAWPAVLWKAGFAYPGMSLALAGAYFLGVGYALWVLHREPSASTVAALIAGSKAWGLGVLLLALLT